MEATGDPQADIRRPLDESAPLTVDTSLPLRPSIPPTTAPARAPRHARPGVSRRVARRVRAGLARTAAWTRQPAGRFALPGLLTAALVGSALTAGGLLLPQTLPASQANVAAGVPSVTATATSTAPPGGGLAPVDAPPVDPVAPPDATSPAASPSATALPADVLLTWAQQTSIRTGVPVVALQAYGYAELVLAETAPDCNLRWTTLAAIGHVESDHGRANGASLLDDGRAWPPIVGDPLDGRDGRAYIADTDGGRLDGDPVYDRAVGPMQFIPTTWEESLIDATGDGVADVHNIHDAALAAANYLCRGGRDLSRPDDWWAAILSYNNVQAYANEVFSVANDYGRRSRA